MPDLDSLVVATRAQVRAVRASDADLAALAQQATGGEPLADAFFWRNEISSTVLDAYFTRMDAATTLANFAADAAAGVAFLAGHNNRVLPFGRTLTGTLEAIPDGARVLADAYTVRGLELGGVKTDDFIRGVEAAIVRDVSVGFSGGQWVCSICGLDMRRSWDCWHVPGITYEVEDLTIPTKPVMRDVLATATIVDAHLCEVSAVYDGATPGAAILRAQQAAEAGQLSGPQARLLEQRYRLHLPDRRIQRPGVSLPPAPAASAPPAPRAAATNEEPMDPEQTEEARAVDAELISVTEITGLRDFRAAVLAVVPEGTDVAAHIRQLVTEAARLAPLAADGQTYRDDTIADALAQGVRALGATFDADVYRPVVDAAPLATLKRMRDDWKAIGDARFPAGRQSVDTVETPADSPKTPVIPDAAFAG